MFMRRYSVLTLHVQGEPVKELRKKGTALKFLPVEELFEAIRECHQETGHGRRDITKNAINSRFANVTKEQIDVFLDLCETCHLKKKKVRKSLVVKPIISNDLNSRAQVGINLIFIYTTMDGICRSP